MLPSSGKEQRFPSCLPLTGIKWLFREASGSRPVLASKWVRFHLSNSSRLSTCFLLMLAAVRKSRVAQLHPSQGYSRSQPLSCVWSEEVGPLIGKTARETQPPGSPSARRIANHCLLGKRTTLPHTLACGNLMTASVSAVWVCPDERTCLVITTCGDLPPYPFH